jgi:long-subunit fatty acid transport protein
MKMDDRPRPAEGLGRTAEGRAGDSALVFVFAFALLAFALLAMAPVSAFGQDINEAVTMEDLGFTDRLASGARAAGMAGTYTAAADDAYALFYNPAGLARLRRIDFSIGFEHSMSEVKNVFYGNSSAIDLSATTLDAFSMAYPVPTYRGSLVVAGGVYRMFTSDLDLLNDGYNSDTDTFDQYRLQQTGSAYSYTVGVGADLSPSVSVGLNGFLLDGTVNALTQFRVDYTGPFTNGDLETETLVDDAEVDLDGYGMVLGLQYHPHRLLHFGLTVTTPIPVNLQGGAVEQWSYYLYNDQDEYYEDYPYIDADYKIPFRFDAGLSLTFPRLLIEFDAGYSDWAQAEANDVRLKDENLDPVFRSVLDLRLGAELVVPGTPIRLRGGYALTPYALDRLDSDRIAYDERGDDVRKAEIETERQTIALGAGVFLGGVFMFDASYEYQTGKRSIPTLVDERTSERITLTGSYRF